MSINGQQIKGSPFTLRVANNYYEAIDKPTKTIETKQWVNPGVLHLAKKEFGEWLTIPIIVCFV